MLAAHYYICTAVGFSKGERDFRHSGLAIGVEELGTVRNDCTVLLHGSRQESGHVHERDERDVERIAEAHEAGGLAAGVYVQHARHLGGLIGHNSYTLSTHVGESYYYITREVLMYFEKLSVIYDFADDLVHVIRLVGMVRDYAIQQSVGSVLRVRAGDARCCLRVVRRQET